MAKLCYVINEWPPNSLVRSILMAIIINDGVDDTETVELQNDQNQNDQNENQSDLEDDQSQQELVPPIIQSANLSQIHDNLPTIPEEITKKKLPAESTSKLESGATKV